MGQTKRHTHTHTNYCWEQTDLEENCVVNVNFCRNKARNGKYKLRDARMHGADVDVGGHEGVNHDDERGLGSA